MSEVFLLGGDLHCNASHVVGLNATVLSYEDLKCVQCSAINKIGISNEAPNWVVVRLIWQS